MKAIVRVKSGSVRIFGTGDSKRVGEIVPVASPYEQEVEGGWGVGSASGLPAGVVAGGFEVEALEEGILRVYEHAEDPSTGSVTSSTASHSEAFEAGGVKSFATHDSNALTVQSVTGELAIPPEPTERVKAAPPKPGGAPAKPVVPPVVPAAGPRPAIPTPPVPPKK